VFLALGCAGTKKEYHQSKEDQDQLVTLPAAIQAAACNVFWKVLEGQKKLLFPL